MTAAAIRSQTAPRPVSAPFIVLRDTREQSPWMFQGLTAGADQGHAPLLVETRLASLHAGDYSALGLEEVIRLERKSGPDLYATLSHGRDRFEAELERLAVYPFSCVVVEANFDELVRRPPSKMRPRSFVGSVVALQQRFPRTHWMFAGSRAVAMGVAFRMLERCWRDRTRRPTLP